MSAEGPSSHVVILGESKEIPTVQIAEALAAHKKIPFQDAIHDVRVSWGFLGHNLAEMEAHELAAALISKGIPAQALPVDSLRDLPIAQFVKALELRGAELVLTLPSGEMHSVAYDQIKVIAGTGLTVREVSKEKVTEGRTNTQKMVNVGLLLSGIPLSVGKRKTVVEKTTVKEDILFYLDLLVEGPTRRFRIDAQALSYSFLKERMLHNTLQNFKTLLGELTRSAPQAHVNRGTRFLVKNQILTQMGYESFSDLERETLWLSAI